MSLYVCPHFDFGTTITYILVNTTPYRVRIIPIN